MNFNVRGINANSSPCIRFDSCYVWMLQWSEPPWNEKHMHTHAKRVKLKLTHTEFEGGVNSINMVMSRPANTAACVPTVTVRGSFQVQILRCCCVRCWDVVVWDVGEQQRDKSRALIVQGTRNSLKLVWWRLNSFSFKAVACCFIALCSWSLSAANIVKWRE